MSIVLRILLGIVFLFSGWVKAIDPMGLSLKIEEYLFAFDLGEWGMISVVSAVLLSGFEILTGLFLIFGILKKITSLVLLCLMTVFTIVTFYIMIFPDSGIKDCGCFGDAFRLTNTGTFIKNIVLLALASIYVKILYKLDWREQDDKYVVKIIIAATISLYIPIFSIIFLPVYDYLPFNVGVDLRKEKQQQDIQYIEFNVLDKNFNTITEDIIDKKDNVFIVTIKNVRNMSLQTMTKLNQITEKIKELDFKCYVITSLDISELKHIWDVKDDCISYAVMDNTTLKSLVRCDYGLIWIKDGIIKGKWNLKYQSLEDFSIEKLENSFVEKSVVFYSILFFLCCGLIFCCFSGGGINITTNKYSRFGSKYPRASPGNASSPSTN